MTAHVVAHADDPLGHTEEHATEGAFVALRGESVRLGQGRGGADVEGEEQGQPQPSRHGGGNQGRVEEERVGVEQVRAELPRRLGSALPHLPRQRRLRSRHAPEVKPARPYDLDAVTHFARRRLRRRHGEQSHPGGPRRDDARIDLSQRPLAAAVALGQRDIAKGKDAHLLFPAQLPRRRGDAVLHGRIFSAGILKHIAVLG